MYTILKRCLTVVIVVHSVLFTIDCRPPDIHDKQVTERHEDIFEALNKMYEYLPDNMPLGERCKRYAALLTMSETHHEPHQLAVNQLAALHEDVLDMICKMIDSANLISHLRIAIERYTTTKLDPPLIDLVECLRQIDSSLIGTYQNQEFTVITELYRDVLKSTSQLIDLESIDLSGFNSAFKTRLNILFEKNLVTHDSQSLRGRGRCRRKKDRDEIYREQEPQINPSEEMNLNEREMIERKRRKNRERQQRFRRLNAEYYRKIQNDRRRKRRAEYLRMLQEDPSNHTAGHGDNYDIAAEVREADGTGGLQLQQRRELQRLRLLRAKKRQRQLRLQSMPEELRKRKEREAELQKKRQRVFRQRHLQYVRERDREYARARRARLRQLKAQAVLEEPEGAHAGSPKLVLSNSIVDQQEVGQHQLSHAGSMNLLGLLELPKFEPLPPSTPNTRLSAADRHIAPAAPQTSLTHRGVSLKVFSPGQDPSSPLTQLLGPASSSRPPDIFEGQSSSQLLARQLAPLARPLAQSPRISQTPIDLRVASPAQPPPVISPRSIITEEVQSTGQHDRLMAQNQSEGFKYIIDSGLEYEDTNLGGMETTKQTFDPITSHGFDVYADLNSQAIRLDDVDSVIQAFQEEPQDGAPSDPRRGSDETASE